MTQINLVAPTIAVVYTQTVILTDAQIKALPTTGIQIVAAPGANKVAVPIMATAVLDNTAGAYTADAGSIWQLFWAITPGPEVSGLVVVDGELADVTAKHLVSFPVPLFGWDAVEGYFTHNVNRLVTAITNQPLVIKDDYNGVANYTGGHANNTLTVTVDYRIIDV